jgi:hypothetical protein
LTDELIAKVISGGFAGAEVLKNCTLRLRSGSIQCGVEGVPKAEAKGNTADFCNYLRYLSLSVIPLGLILKRCKKRPVWRDMVHDSTLYL